MCQVANIPQPVGSRIQVEKTADGLTLSWAADINETWHIKYRHALFDIIWLCIASFIFIMTLYTLYSGGFGNMKWYIIFWQSGWIYGIYRSFRLIQKKYPCRYPKGLFSVIRL